MTSTDALQRKWHEVHCYQSIQFRYTSLRSLEGDICTAIFAGIVSIPIAANEQTKQMEDAICHDHATPPNHDAFKRLKNTRPLRNERMVAANALLNARTKTIRRKCPADAPKQSRSASSFRRELTDCINTP